MGKKGLGGKFVQDGNSIYAGFTAYYIVLKYKVNLEGATTTKS